MSDSVVFIFVTFLSGGGGGGLTFLKTKFAHLTANFVFMSDPISPSFIQGSKREVMKTVLFVNPAEIHVCVHIPQNSLMNTLSERLASLGVTFLHHTTLF